MLKVAIWPSFTNKSLLEIKRDAGKWTLLVTKQSYGEGDFNDPGGIWIKNDLDTQLSEKLISKSKEIIIDPQSDLRVILDGVSVVLTLKQDNEEIKSEFRSPVPESKEQQFVYDLIELVKTNINDIECLDYIELLEQYFFEVSPIKEFNETQYRLKLVGGLSINDKSELELKFKTLRSRQNPVIDMTNFFSIGRALDECFLDIQKLKGLTVLANKYAHLYLTEIGFDSRKIKLKRTPNNV